MRCFLWAAAAAMLCGPSLADSVLQSKRLLARVETVSLATALSAVRPMARPVVRVTQVEAEQPAGFTAWLAAFRVRATAAGITSPTLDAALSEAAFDEAIIKRDRNQAEFTKTIWDYLDTAVSDGRIANGNKALAAHGDTLHRIEKEYGVDHQIVAAIWGLESAFGTFTGGEKIVSALATLAFDGRRSAFFEQQLIAALQILQDGDVGASGMKGSWAGAMGHTQFMPTSYLEHAVDFTGDGKRDIWGEDPSDALASTAAYLKHFGWTKGQPWGVEIQLPDEFDYMLADRKVVKSPVAWARLGIRDVDGMAVPDHGEASILLPGGAEGAAFMIFDNFAVLERYNTADAYVIGVGHLGDRLLGQGPLQASWPRGDRALSFDERIELQERLTAAGFDTVKIDGKIGPLTIASVRGWQKSAGLVPDGYASLRALDQLRLSK